MRFFLCACLFALSAKGYSQTSEKGVKPIAKTVKDGRTFAVIVGISNYAALPKLNFADDDAINFHAYLKQTANAADAGNISLFVNENATRDAITDKLYTITDSLQKGDNVYLYFSGHGDIEQLVQTDNCLLLLANSPTKNYLRKSNAYLDVQLFRSFFESWGAKGAKVFFVCDACHSGSLIGGETGRQNTLLSLQQAWNKEIKLFSCQPDELSLEGAQWGGGRGLFSFYLVLGMKGLADKDNNSAVTLFELDSYLKDKVGNTSGQAQIPLSQGDYKVVMSNVRPQMLAAAKIESTDNSQHGSLALRGDDGLEYLLKDSSDKKYYRLFVEKLQKVQLLEPENYSAYHFFNLLKQRNANPLLLADMKLKLLQSLQKSYDLLLDFVYEDQYEKLGTFEKTKIENELNVALSLASGRPEIENQLRSKLLFLNACEAVADIRPNSISYENTEKLTTGIRLLKEALKYNAQSPNIYLKLGDFYLYTNQLQQSIAAYKQFQQMLPNDEFSYNRLGMAYMSLKDVNNATQSFEKAVKINPRYDKALENLRIAKKQAR